MMKLKRNHNFLNIADAMCEEHLAGCNEILFMLEKKIARNAIEVSITDHRESSGGYSFTIITKTTTFNGILRGNGMQIRKHKHTGKFDPETWMYFIVSR